MIEILRAYFLLGLCYRDILRCLASMHGIVISMRTLKRLLKAESLYRRKYFTDVLDVALFIQQEVMGSGAMLGYRLMHHKCIQHGFTVSQDTVRLLLHIIDPEGIASRRRHRLVRRVYMNLGPNYLWHIDGYDKLNPMEYASVVQQMDFRVIFCGSKPMLQTVIRAWLRDISWIPWDS